ncbi:hypothetical protein DSCW_04510 [Desulfosarcina widdelii]|uniref:Uncharacterized protein n=1 Tax=Desulfosarcina widdelii TaxID=947919 RepID=A0A5K7Z3I6_9BACT|nr:hypothetical protein DSCW_04510 [Desulfosarcina widdelii]
MLQGKKINDTGLNPGFAVTVEAQPPDPGKSVDVDQAQDIAVSENIEPQNRKGPAKEPFIIVAT